MEFAKCLTACHKRWTKLSIPEREIALKAAVEDFNRAFGKTLGPWDGPTIEMMARIPNSEDLPIKLLVIIMTDRKFMGE
jgi:hypothetical protein